MLKKLTKQGTNLALVIDRPLLDLLKIDPETPLDISTDGKRLTVAPVYTAGRPRKFGAPQQWPHKSYGKPFNKHGA
jgi:antitoxin MazE